MEMSFKNCRKVESKNRAVMGLGCFSVAFFFTFANDYCMSILKVICDVSHAENYDQQQEMRN